MSLEIVPSIDLRGGRVVRLKQGDYARQVSYDVDPVEAARAFAEAGARWAHLVDLDGAKEGRPVQTDLISRIISRCGLKVEAGGGVRSVGDIRSLLDAGAARVVIGTRAVEDWEWFDDLAHHGEFDRKIVLALDAREGIIATRGWTQSAVLVATDVARRVNGWPLAAILYTDVNLDGMLQGPNLAYTRALAEAGDVPVIASGGVASLEHIRQLMDLPIWGAIIGRALYEGTLDLREAVHAVQAGA